tara:strand:- start:1280 stop:1741 length:462 start_codon:yes stop_codon:yes gene_type:complete
MTHREKQIFALNGENDDESYGRNAIVATPARFGGAEWDKIFTPSPEFGVLSKTYEGTVLEEGVKKYNVFDVSRVKGSDLLKWKPFGSGKIDNEVRELADSAEQAIRNGERLDERVGSYLPGEAEGNYLIKAPGRVPDQVDWVIAMRVYGMPIF